MDVFHLEPSQRRLIASSELPIEPTPKKEIIPPTLGKKYTSQKRLDMLDVFLVDAIQKIKKDLPESEFNKVINQAIHCGVIEESERSSYSYRDMISILDRTYQDIDIRYQHEFSKGNLQDRDKKGYTKSLEDYLN